MLIHSWGCSLQVYGPLILNSEMVVDLRRENGGSVSSNAEGSFWVLFHTVDQIVLVTVVAGLAFN